MNFLFDSNKMKVTSENYGNIGKDVYLMMYYYSIEYFEQDFVKSLSKEHLSFVKNESDKHIQNLKLILKLLASLKVGKLKREEKVSLQNIIVKSFNEEASILASIEINSMGDFSDWFIENIKK